MHLPYLKKVAIRDTRTRSGFVGVILFAALIFCAVLAFFALLWTFALVMVIAATCMTLVRSLRSTTQGGDNDGDGGGGSKQSTIAPTEREARF